MIGENPKLYGFDFVNPLDEPLAKVLQHGVGSDDRDARRRRSARAVEQFGGRSTACDGALPERAALESGRGRR